MTILRSKAIISLGGNLPLGEMSPRQILLAAIQEISLLMGEQCQVSRLFQTPCFPAGAGPDFVNAALTVETRLSPEALLQCLHGVEQKFSRLRKQRWGTRTLDLDLISLSEKVFPDLATHQRWRDLPLEQQVKETPDQLILPHPRMQDRAFVLVPMCDICPEWRHPILGKTAAELCAELPKSDLEAVQPL
ncbi:MULTISPECIES: 2-amino-4-hydroxy-6-hydroxymethyldihydropteridine diphosphokinase [unclassified Pseudophaeobacter]|uniref:2-amino-4-hydroxy-6- hydroxymethyldihydropteridine diphosphokinase n=1 Tax=unclassified Pseudophaeobacter TaxID=2637024 RepID=UPI000EFD937E|nr:2-amino-4-hydroxy-6-hydroxymethyldihydropteridine diphosphokinase [Pseudophaeobacter sp. EL27]